MYAVLYQNSLLLKYTVVYAYLRYCYIYHTQFAQIRVHVNIVHVREL